MNTLNITARRAVTMSVLGGAAVLTAAPAYAAVAPVSPAAVGSASQSKAQVEHSEKKYIHDSRTGFGRKAQVERMKRELHPQPVQPVGGTSDPSDPSSVPVTVLALIGGSLAAGAAGFTVYRFRHHGPVAAGTA